MLGICLNDGLHEGARGEGEGAQKGEQLKAGKIAFHLVTSRAITWPVAIARPSMSSPLLLLLLLSPSAAAAFAHLFFEAFAYYLIICSWQFLAASSLFARF